MTLTADGKREFLRRILVRPHAGPGPIPQFDPLEPPPLAERAPPVQTQHMTPFTACHVLAFGTAYTIGHYRNEVEQRLFAREALTTPYDNGYPLTSPEAAIIKWLEWADNPRAAHQYAEVKTYAGQPIAKRLQLAAGVLMEAARRSEVTVSAVREGAKPFDYTTLKLEDFLERPDLRYWTEILVERGAPDIPKVEFNKVRFLRDEVMRLRSAAWHTMAPPPSAASGPRKGPRLRGQIVENLPAVVRAIPANELSLRRAATELAKLLPGASDAAAMKKRADSVRTTMYKMGISEVDLPTYAAPEL